jgi:hypothetical protein
MPDFERFLRYGDIQQIMLRLRQVGEMVRCAGLGECREVEKWLRSVHVRPVARSYVWEQC